MTGAPQAPAVHGAREQAAHAVGADEVPAHLGHVQRLNVQLPKRVQCLPIQHVQRWPWPVTVHHALAGPHVHGQNGGVERRRAGHHAGAILRMLVHQVDGMVPEEQKQVSGIVGALKMFMVSS